MTTGENWDDWGEISHIVLYQPGPELRWWQWRQKRKRMKPILFDVDRAVSPDGTGTVTITSDLRVILR